MRRLIPPATSGLCIVCGTETTDRTLSGGRKHWRCGDGEECAVRRNARKSRPRPEAEIRRGWRDAHPSSALNVREEVDRLKRLTWMTLQREALTAGLTITRIREARSRDELRLAILKAKIPRLADG